MMSMRPFNEIRKLENEISNVFRNMRDKRLDQRFYRLNVDILETPEKYTVKAHLPGFTKDDVSIEASSQYLTIKAKREDEEIGDKTEWLVQELQNLHLRRRISFDKPVNPKESETTLRNGILTITLPKMEESKSTKLEINTPELEE